ncbi:MAG: hypothetical protein A3E79_00215 [Burkholderiales bacterium RIFCSPHIGHO2_12_FULL_61_11]|nr:MAG: hypothetical protein A3E79_00215 [Burkholderiales bacterium RIFCSPHIGHO2_12_FULL_61_11]
MTLLSAYYDLLLPELPGCTTTMLDLHLRETARTFCQQTGAWKLPFDAVNLVADVATYDLSPSESQAEVVRITRLTLDGELMWEDTDRPQRHTDDAEPKYTRNEPPFSLSPDLLEITLITDEMPTAAVVGGMEIIGTMKPTSTATQIPDFLKRQYSDAMRYGTLARLMVMAKKPWTDRALATYYSGEWNKALNFAAYQAQVGNTREHLRVKKWG